MENVLIIGVNLLNKLDIKSLIGYNIVRVKMIGDNFMIKSKPKTPASVLRAVKKYDKAHPEQRRYNSYKSHARIFIRDYATAQDLRMIATIFKARAKQLQQEGKWNVNKK